MQPNDQQPTQPLGSNYLDSISTAQPVKTVNPLLLWGLIIGVLALVIFVVIGVSSTAGGTPSASLTSVASTLSNLQTVSESGQKNIQSGELRSLNSSLTLTLTNTNRDLAGILKTQKISLKDTKNNKSLIAVKKDFDALNVRLEDARLNAVYDRTYAREITYSLKTLHANMGQLYTSTNSKSLKSTLDKADVSLKLLLEGFEKFNES